MGHQRGSLWVPGTRWSLDPSVSHCGSRGDPPPRRPRIPCRNRFRSYIASVLGVRIIWQESLAKTEPIPARQWRRELQKSEPPPRTWKTRGWSRPTPVDPASPAGAKALEDDWGKACSFLCKGPVRKDIRLRGPPVVSATYLYYFIFTTL